MGLESGATQPSNLNSSWPLDTDTRREGAAHIRETKLCLQNFSKNLSGSIASKSWCSTIYPIGSTVVTGPESSANPTNYIGGTWYYAGKLTLNQANVVPPAPTAWAELWVWYRSA